MNTSNNGFIAIGKKLCPVCGKTHSRDGEILIHKQLKDIPEEHTITGLSLCEEHHQLFKDGYIALVGCDSNKSVIKENGNADFNEAYRTGDVIHLKEKVFVDLIDTTLPKDGLAFCDQKVIEILKKMS